MSGAQVGDVLLEIDGFEIDESIWIARRDAGVSFKIVTEADRRTIEYSGQKEMPANSVVAVWWTTSIVFALASFFVFWRSNRSPEVLAASILFFAAATAFAVAPAGARWIPWALHVLSVSIDWSASLFLVFFYLLWSGHKGGSRRLGSLAWAMAAWALAINISYSLAITVFPEIHTVMRRASFAQIAVGLLGGIALLISSYINTDSVPMRERLRIMVFGISMAVLPFVVLSVVPVAMGTSALVRAEFTILALIFLPLSFGYAILRHQLMGIRRLVHRGAAYVLITSVILIIYASLIAILRSVGGSDVSDNVSVQIVLLAVLFAAVPFMSGSRRLALLAVDRLLYRDYVDHSGLTRRASVSAASANDMDGINRSVLGTIARELRLSFAAFVWIDNGRVSVKSSVGDIPKVFVDSLGKQVGQDDSSSVSQMRVNSQQATAVLVTVSRRAQRMWVLCLGPKETEEPFGKEDLDLAQSVAGHVATMVEKLELIEELQTKAAELSDLNQRLIHSQETERARVASYLHDEPLQQITDLIWRHADSDLPPAVEDELRRITHGLRNFTAGLHPAVLEHLGLVRALEWLGSEMTATAGINVIFDNRDLRPNDEIHSEIELSVHRIAQEALTNCQRHSEADTVWLRLYRGEDQVELVVEDDGVGIASPDNEVSGAKLGIVGMRERAHQMAGSLRVESRKPRGTKVVASFPLKCSRTTAEPRSLERT